jgi:hypothetical protein
MAFTDSVVRTAAPGTDRTAGEATGGTNQGDHLQQYRLGQSDTSLKGSNRTDTNPKYIDLAESPPLSSKPSTTRDGSGNAGGLNTEELKKKIESLLQHKTDGSAPPAETSAKPDIHFGNDTYFSQPVYGTDSKAVAQTVEKYGSKLDYHQKQNLDDMISATSLGQTDRLKEALQNSTPEARNAYAEVMRKEMGRDVDLTNKDNGGYDLSIYGDSGLTKIDIAQDKKSTPANVSSGFLNGKAIMNTDPWKMTTDPKYVNQAIDKLSDSAGKYRKEVGETR